MIFSRMTYPLDLELMHSRPQIFKRGALGGVAGDEIKRKGEDDVLEKGAEKDFSEKSQ